MDPGAGSTVNRDEANAFVSQFDGRLHTACSSVIITIITTAAAAMDCANATQRSTALLRISPRAESRLADTHLRP
jgi:hypothetical protein